MIYFSAGQCPVSVPTIVSSSSSDDICRVVSQETLTYTCNNDDNVLTWSSSVFDGGTFAVVAAVPVPAPSSTVSGVTFNESNNNDGSCLNSTLTFNGTLTSLTALNGVTLICTSTGENPSSITIMIPSKWVLMCNMHSTLSE